MCALISFLSAQLYTQRQIAVTVLLIVSRVELASYLLYRVLKRGRDERFDAIRGNFFAFLGFWIGQVTIHLPNAHILTYSACSCSFALADCMGVGRVNAGVIREW
jgi:uncharacterized BrkB/YihY/UPF0761 family membrane protein